jgi:hypothetical protein
MSFGQGALRQVQIDAGASIWGQVSLVVAFAAFLGILLYLFVRRRPRWEQSRRMPLDDEHPQQFRPPGPLRSKWRDRRHPADPHTVDRRPRTEASRANGRPEA